MAGAVDLLLYGIAVFISPVAVYFKKGVGVQFWVNCCLYCLMGVPGMIHAFYIIHTNKSKEKAPPQSHAVPNPVTQEYASRRPSLPHSDRYRPPTAFSPYEDHPPPVPAKREDQLAYDPALHPNNRNTPIGRAKAVLHTYQIPESTLHPSPLRARRPTPSPDPPPRPNPSPRPELPPLPQPEPESETRATSSTAHPDPGTLPYPAGYHPNSTGANISNAKAVLHTYQIPETTLTAPDGTPAPPPAEPEETLKRSKTTASIMKGSMWPLRSKGKGLSPLDVNSPTAVPKPDSTLHRSKWSASGPSWLKRRREREEQGKGMVTTDDEGPATMTMVWDDNFEVLQPVNQESKPAKGHARSVSEPVALAFPAPPGAIRPVVDRTGTSNTVLLNPVRRRDAGLEAVDENTPAPETTMSESEAPLDQISQTHGHAGSDTEIVRSKSRLITRLGRRQSRPPLDTVPDDPPTSTASAPAKTESESPTSATWHRHIAPPAVLATSIDEPRSGFFHRRRSSSEHSPEPANASPRSASSLRRDIDFTIGEYGLGGSGDAYSAGSRALRRRDRSGSGGGARRLPVGASGGKRLSSGTAFSQDTMSTPLMRRGWTQGTFGTGVTDITADTSAATEGGGKARSTSNRSKSYEDAPREERSQDEHIEEWIQREDERRSASAMNSRAPTSHGHSSSPGERHVVPDEESLFSEESSGFAGIGVGTAVEKGRTGRLEVWDQPNWDGSNPSASAQSHSNQGASIQSSSNRDGYPYANLKHEDDPFKDPADSSVVTHSSYATGKESPPATNAPISPPISPERPARPTRAPPAAPGPSSSTNLNVKPGIPRMATFGAVGGEDASPSFASLSEPIGAPKSSVSTSSPRTHTISPPASPPRPPVSSKPAIYKAPPVPTRPHAAPARAQSPRLPPKPAVLRTLSTEDDDMSEVYARALRDEI